MSVRDQNITVLQRPDGSVCPDAEGLFFCCSVAFITACAGINPMTRPVHSGAYVYQRAVPAINDCRGPAVRQVPAFRSAAR